MAALDYSKQRFVVYVAAKPPRSIFRSIAAHLNRRIIYIPIGALNPARLEKAPRGARARQLRTPR
jgi:hypothetical protein